MKIVGKVKLYNGHFREARINAGFDTIASLSLATKIGASVLCEYEGLKRIPAKNSEHIRKLEDALRCLIEDLFPEDVYLALKNKLGRTFWFKKEVDIKSIPWANPNLIEHKPFEGYVKDAVNKALDTLTDREKDILEKRFFDGMSLRDVGKSVPAYSGIYKKVRKGKGYLEPERVRQIEAKALKKLRHPSRSRELRMYIDG